jgi:hypothetical protein
MEVSVVETTKIKNTTKIGREDDKGMSVEKQNFKKSTNCVIAVVQASQKQVGSGHKVLALGQTNVLAALSVSQ